MNRVTSQPVILPLPTLVSTLDESPTIPFPSRGRSLRRRRTRRRANPQPRDNDRNVDRESPLGQMRGRLLKMIIANEWDRKHGHRAS